MKPRVSWNPIVVRVTLDGITHAARYYSSSGVVVTVCEIPAGKGRIYQTGSVLACEAPAVDCMSCLVHESQEKA